MQATLAGGLEDHLGKELTPKLSAVAFDAQDSGMLLDAGPRHRAALLLA